MSIQEITSLVSAVTALVALSVSSIITLRVTRQAALSPLKHKWVDEFREAIAEYQGCGFQLDLAFKLKGNSDELLKNARDLGGRFSFLERRLVLLATLMFVPEGDECKEFFHAVSQVYKAVTEQKLDSAAVSKVQDKLTLSAIGLLRKEYVALYEGKQKS
jgi:hypothetical protein